MSRRGSSKLKTYTNGLKFALGLCITLAFILLCFRLRMYSTIITKEPNYLVSNSVVFIIRTYHGHFSSDRIYNLKQCFKSLQALENPYWKAYLINTDTEQLPTLPLEFESDNRFEYLNLNSPKPYNQWVAGYDVTDAALAILKESEFKWFVITNGDNIYDPRFLNYLPNHNDVDIVAVDYWSRYKISDYELQPINMNVSICHRAELKLGFVDLGGVILSLPRFHKENLKFMNFG
eukprot:gene7988-16343_t